MEYGFSVLMLIFGGVLLLYGLLMFLTRDYKLVPFRARQSAVTGDTKIYARQLAKCVMLTALSPLIGGAVGFIFNIGVAGAVTILLMILFLYFSTRIMKDFY